MGVEDCKLAWELGVDWRLLGVEGDSKQLVMDILVDCMEDWKSWLLVLTVGWWVEKFWFSLVLVFLLMRVCELVAFWVSLLV